MSEARVCLTTAWLSTAAVVCLTIACATPSARIEAQARQLGFARDEVVGTTFRHTVFGKALPAETSILHVYIGGDGSPARAVRNIPADPTPRREPMLRLMALDDGPSLFLGRPCYHDTGPCDPLHWTQGRYGEPVVASMVEALVNFAKERQLSPNLRWVLIGFSGGGTLATLMAERLPGTSAVITIAGNLDIDAWATHHGYRALDPSLNPVERPALRSDIVQIHLRGGRDTNIPGRFAREFMARQPRAREVVEPAFDHACCWEEIWPDTLEDLERELQSDSLRMMPQE